MEIAPEIYVLLTCVTVLSGFIDAIAGGGGLLTVPAMLATGLPPINVLATNKLQSICGTSVATYNFSRAGRIDWKAHRFAILCTLIGSIAGAITISHFSPKLLAMIVPILLIAVAAYVLLSPRMHDEDAHQRLSGKAYAPVAGGIGFYDGFFGPGTGSFFTTTMVALRGYGLTRATAHTKALNLTSNVGSVIVFAWGGHMYWLLGLCMGLGAMTGAYIGSHTAMKFGAKIIRPLLFVISIGLTAKIVWDYFGK